MRPAHKGYPSRWTLSSFSSLLWLSVDFIIYQFEQEWRFHQDKTVLIHLFQRRAIIPIYHLKMKMRALLTYRSIRHVKLLFVLYAIIIL